MRQIRKDIVPIGERLSEYLAKALAVHPSQNQQRSRSGQFARPHHSRVQARNEQGRFIGLLPDGERDAAKKRAPDICSELRDRLGRHLADLQKKRITSEIASDRGREDILSYYDQLYRIGKQGGGNPGIILSPTDNSMIARAAKDEGDYFSGFMRDVDAGRGVMPYPKRLECYGNAGMHAYWLGWTMASASPRRRITWHLGETEEHCEDCDPLAKRGPMTVKDFMSAAINKGLVPQSGDLACKGIHCKCYLSDSYVNR